MNHQEHRRIRGEYEARLRELEAERHMVEEDLAQVDKYKQLLLKQRDIMIALTARLNERDEQIMTLQVGSPVHNQGPCPGSSSGAGRASFLLFMTSTGCGC